MGMICVFWQASQQQVDGLLKLSIFEVEEKVYSLFHEDLEDKNECDIDKAWDELNYVFCDLNQKDVWPNNFIFGGEILGATDIDFNENEEKDPIPTFRWYNVEQVKEISQFLNFWNRETVRTKLYSTNTTRENIYLFKYANDPEMMLDNLCEDIDVLRRFFQKVSDANECVVTSIE